jgi:hypothetical protein
MSILTFLIYSSIFNLLIAQQNFPTWPMTGHDSISIHSPNEAQTTNSSKTIPTNQKSTPPNIMTNGSITVNTTNMSPDCTLECYTGCRVLFPEFIEQKYCIINVCKCQIIEKEENPGNLSNNITRNSSIQIVNADINKYSAVAYLNIDKKQLSDEFKNEQNNFYWVFYLLIFIASFGYEYYIWNYISEKNEFSLTNWLCETKDTQFKKYRIVNGNEYDNNNIDNDDELRRCLL